MKRRCRMNPLNEMFLDAKKIGDMRALSIHKGKRGIWTDKDVRVLASKANQRKIEGMFSRSLFTWRIAFLTEDVGDMELVKAETDFDVISVAFLGSTGDPMTAWMAAHRISHAISDGKMRFNASQATTDFYDYVGNFLYEKTGGNNDYSEILTMRSARMQKIDGRGEAMHEVLAQFIHDGKIRLYAGYEVEGREMNSLATTMLKSLQENRVLIMDGSY